MSTGTKENLKYDFGPFRLDPAERLLLRDGHAVPVTPKAFELLVYLVEHHGRLVEKHSLMSALWPDTVVEEGNLVYNIWALRKALEDGRDDAKFIETVPTRGYRFVAPVTRAEVGESGSGIRPRSRWRPPGNVIWLAIVALTVGVAVSVFVFRLWPSPPAPMRSSPLTSLPGQERHPSFSPDGNQIAFAWDGENGDNQDIYIKVVGAGVPLRLTTHPAADQKPAWSSDGRHIAFVRSSEEGSGIFVIPALGGPERKIASLHRGTTSGRPDRVGLQTDDCSRFLKGRRRPPAASSWCP